MSPNPFRRYTLFGLAVVLLVAGSLWLKAGPAPDTGQNETKPLSFDLGGPFTLTDAGGRPVNEASWPGKLLLIYFGYRFCPDICPTTLQTIATAVDRLGPDGEKVQPLFITVDPARDRPEMLPAYVGLFHPRLIGLTGTPDQIAAIARLFRVYYHKVDSADPETYTIDHSAFSFLVGEHGKVLKIFGHETSADAMAAEIKARLIPARVKKDP